MSVVTRTHETRYAGPDVDKVLRDTFPTVEFAKRCECLEAGVILQQASKTVDNLITVPSSLSVVCDRCMTQCDAALRLGRSGVK